MDNPEKLAKRRRKAKQ